MYYSLGGNSGLLDIYGFKSTAIFSAVCVTRSLVSCVCFVDCCLSFCSFSFGHCVVCSSSISDSDYPFGIFKLFIQYNYVY